MNTSRRKFLINGSLSVAGALFLSRCGSSKAAMPAGIAGDTLLGVQLYSVRDEMKKDPLGTMKALAEIGYKNVEHANYVDGKFYGYEPVEFKKILDDLGLNMPSGHTVMNDKHWDKSANDFTDVWKKTVTDAAIVGQHYVISPWLDEGLRKNYDEMVAFLDVFNKCGELCQKSGMKFGYHNHDFEFKYSLNGQQLYDIILDKTDPNLVIQQIDVGNMYGGGGIALDVIKKHPGRFQSMHVKDEIKATGAGEMGNSYESTVLGKGILPVKDIVAAGVKIGGTKDLIIEQESYQGLTPIAAVKEDLEIMKSWGY